MTTTTTPAVMTTTDAGALERLLRAAGFTPGPPPGLSDACRAIDARIARGMKCPRCRRRGCAYRPFYTPAGRYRILAACRSAACGGAEEL